MKFDESERFLQMVHYYIDNCDSKMLAKGMVICTVLTEPCQVGIKGGRCPILIEKFGRREESE